MARQLRELREVGGGGHILVKENSKSFGIWESTDKLRKHVDPYCLTYEVSPWLKGSVYHKSCQSHEGYLRTQIYEYRFTVLLSANCPTPSEYTSHRKGPKP